MITFYDENWNCQQNGQVKSINPFIVLEQIFETAIWRTKLHTDMLCEVDKDE